MKSLVLSTLGAALVAMLFASFAAAATAPKGDATAGKKVFAVNCASCHGASGEEGGMGPSLKNELKKKDVAHIVKWIKNPAAPMPKLYPSPLTDKDVNNVAAYVAKLK